MFGAFLYVARALLLPVLCAVVVGMTLGPYIGFATKRGVPAWLRRWWWCAAGCRREFCRSCSWQIRLPRCCAACRRSPPPSRTSCISLTSSCSGLQQLQIALGAAPGKEGIDLSLTSMFAGFSTIVTPAALQFVLQLLLFVGTLFFYILGRNTFRSHAVNLFATPRCAAAGAENPQ